MNRMKLPCPIKIDINLDGKIIFSKLFDEYPITIGRSTKCDVPLSQVDFLSRQHCTVTVENGVVTVMDLDSANGIFFGGQKVKQVQINETLEIEIGEIRVHFELQSLAHQETVVDRETTKIRDIERLSKKPKNKEPTVKDINCPIVENKPAAPASTPAPAKSMAPSAPTKPVRIPFDPVPTMHQAMDALEPLEFKNPIPQGAPKKEIKVPYKAPIKAPPAKKAAERPIGSNTSLIEPHYQAAQLRPQQRVLESFVTWKDQVYEVNQYYPGDRVVVGTGGSVNLEIPVLKSSLKLAAYDGMNTQIFIPQNLEFELWNQTKKYSFAETVQSAQVSKKSKFYSMKLGAADLVSIHFTEDVAVHLRYAPAPRQLSKNALLNTDEQLKKTAFTSGIIHFILFVITLIMQDRTAVPEIKNVPERYAKLLVKPPPKKEPPKPEPKKEKVVEKRVEPKKQPKPEKVVRIEKSKILKKVNKYPVEVAKPLKRVEKPVVTNIQAVGALAALSAISKDMPATDQPVAININKNAGGQTALNTGGVIGTLKTSTGKLAAGGLASVKTKGLGYGTGTGYGVQGIKGTAGGRSVAGTVVGAPALVNLSKEDGLSKQQVMDVVKRHMGQIQQCYERSLIDSPNLAGRVEYEWEISPKGKVQWAKVKKSEMAGGDSLNSCIVDIFKKMDFPSSKNGQNTIPNVGFPFGRL